MISRKEISAFDCANIYEFYGYIIDSDENGQFTQVKELVQRLSTEQYNGFLLYLQDNDIKLKDVFLRE